jgi:tripartite-type tricarboxylate transporter receptor subunit TctC
MSLKKLRLASLGAAAVAAAALSFSAPAAADFPDRPVRIVVPYAPGGSVDSMARIVGDKMSTLLKQPFIIENRAGGGSNIGAFAVASAAPDGYTVLLGTSAALATNTSLYSKLNYDPIKDFQPIALGAKLPSMVLVSSQRDIKSIDELNAELKKEGDAAFYASSGNGTPAHLGTELYKHEVGGLKTVHVPYKGGAPALADMVANRATFMIAILPEAAPFVKQGQLRALAVTTKERLPEWPDLPTVAESGIPGYEIEAWYALVAPAGTPADAVATLNKAFNEALQDPTVSTRLKNMGFVIAGGTPEELGAHMKSEKEKWKKVIDLANIKAD